MFGKNVDINVKNKKENQTEKNQRWLPLMNINV